MARSPKNPVPRQIAHRGLARREDGSEIQKPFSRVSPGLANRVQLIVPADCVASCDANDNAHALAQMRKVLKADTCASTELDFRQLNHET